MTDTNSEYVIRFPFPIQQWLHERDSMLRYTYIDRLVTRVYLFSFAWFSVFPHVVKVFGGFMVQVVYKNMDFLVYRILYTRILSHTTRVTPVF
jgi:hypothetical protein